MTGTASADPLDATILRPFLQTPAAAEAVWFFGELDLILAPGERTGERLAVVVHEARRGMSPPWHEQPRDDETFYVLEGEMRFWAGDADMPLGCAGPGTLVFVPRGTPHSFRVESESARWLAISTPAGHERFYRAGGDPAATPALPPDGAAPPDMSRVERAAADHGVEILGQPPTA